MAKQYTLMLNTGYAESGAIYYTPFTSKRKHKDAKAALLHLAEWLEKNYLVYSMGPAEEPCCLKAAENPDTHFCPKCGRPILNKQDFDKDDAENFRSYIIELCRCTNDDIGANELLEDDYYYDPDWEIGVMGKNARIVFNAEEVISAAIGYSSRDDITFEDICKKRTKNKSEDFSFW